MASTTPAPAPAPAPAPKKGGKLVEIVINEETVAKLRVVEDLNISKLWDKFQKDHENHGDKRAVFPTAFIGHLVNDHKAEQISIEDKVDGKILLRI